jgi:cell division protein FtsB
MNSDKNVNVYLTNPEDRQRVYGDDKPDPHKHFIIVQNENLTSESARLRGENSRLQKEIDDGEAEVDKMETQVRYMRGELKNFVELRKMADLITLATEEKEKNTKDQYDLTMKFFPKFLVQFALSKINMVGSCLILWYIDRLTIPYILSTELLTTLTNIVISGVSPYDVMKHKDELELYSIARNKTNTEIEKLRKEVKRADDGNDFITKYIDSM